MAYEVPGTANTNQEKIKCRNENFLPNATIPTFRIKAQTSYSREVLTAAESKPGYTHTNLTTICTTMIISVKWQKMED